MADATGITRNDWLRNGKIGATLPVPDSGASGPKLSVVHAGGSRAAREVNAQLAGLQRRIGEQLLVLEQCMRQQQDALTRPPAAISNLTESLSWLITSFEEQSKAAKAILGKLESVDPAIPALRQWLDQHGEPGLGSLEERTQALAERLDTLASLQEKQEEQLTEWKGPIGNLTKTLELVMDEFQRHDANFASILQSVQSLCDVQNHWKVAMGQTIDALLTAKSPVLS